MARVTDDDLAQLCTVLSNMTGLPIDIEYANGQPRAYLSDETGNPVRYITPRGSKGFVADMLRGAITGVELHSRGHWPILDGALDKVKDAWCGVDRCVPDGPLSPEMDRAYVQMEIAIIAMQDACEDACSR